MSAASTQPGRGIADYAFVEELGAGSYGRFFTARPPERLGLEVDLVAVKVLDRRATDTEFRRVAEELRLFASLGSPHLVDVYDVGYASNGGILYFAMAYHPDGSLGRPAHALERGEAAQAVADAARGAHALHEVGVVHRDIKPSNILLRGGRGLLSDLGLTPLLAPGMTTTGVAPIGTIEFMDPSTLSGGRASRQTDIWSLGLNLHRALTGAGVYAGMPDDSPMEALRHMLRERPAVSGALDPDLRRVVERCIAPEPGQRFPTAAALADEIEQSIGASA